MKTNGKKIIVTGGGNGVGRNLVLQLLKKNATVIAVDINEEALKETLILSGNNSNLFLYQVDISKEEEVMKMKENVMKDHLFIDAIINNAGIIQPFTFLNELDMERIQKVMNINFYGTLFMIKAFLPELLKRPEGHIVNVSSMGGFLPVPGQSAYGASKAAVKLLSEGLSSELEGTNINVSVIIPGGIATEIKKNSEIEYRTTTENKKSDLVMTPFEAASQIIETMEKNKKVNYIGKDCRTMRILYKMSPRLATGLINKVMSQSEH